MKAVWQAWQDLNRLISDPAFMGKLVATGSALVAIGNWLITKGTLPPEMGSSGVDLEDEIDYDEAIREVTTFIETQGAAIPMAAPEMQRGERLMELLEIAMPLLLKFLKL